MTEASRKLVSSIRESLRGLFVFSAFLGVLWVVGYIFFRHPPLKIHYECQRLAGPDDKFLYDKCLKTARELCKEQGGTMNKYGCVK